MSDDESYVASEEEQEEEELDLSVVNPSTLTVLSTRFCHRPIDSVIKRGTNRKADDQLCGDVTCVLWCAPPALHGQSPSDWIIWNLIGWARPLSLWGRRNAEKKNNYVLHPTMGASAPIFHTSFQHKVGFTLLTCLCNAA
jgi:hypothetical protein